MVFRQYEMWRTRTILLAGVLSSGILLAPLSAQSPAQAAAPAQAASPSPAQAADTPSTATPSRYRPNRVSKRAGEYYGLVWGVDSLAVKWTESGEVIRFTYRVLDADKAKVLNEKKNEPSLIDPRVGVKLVVPSLEKVGQLRQTSTPEAGKVYWMAFSNKGRLVKRGDHVDVVIGQFRAEGLVVE
jgi:hypothetical protein